MSKTAQLKKKKKYTHLFRNGERVLVVKRKLDVTFLFFLFSHLKFFLFITLLQFNKVQETRGNNWNWKGRFDANVLQFRKSVASIIIYFVVIVVVVARLYK